MSCCHKSIREGEIERERRKEGGGGGRWRSRERGRERERERERGRDREKKQYLSVITWQSEIDIGIITYIFHRTCLMHCYGIIILFLIDDMD